MRQEIADKVHPVLREGLRLLERLEQGQDLDFETEQARLRELMLSENASRGLRDYASDVGGGASLNSMASLGGSGSGRRGQDHFLGVRYVLACWLDEVFITGSLWEAEWNKHHVEERLYQTNDRAWQFWEQARLAEARPGVDALEVFYLAVMLGFRGELRDEPDKLRTWADLAGRRIAREQKDLKLPADQVPEPNVPPLRGRERLRRMAVAAAAFVLVLIPFLAFYVVYTLGK